ncbi:hypothetical protein BKN38_06805 [Helicobacter sp. CLO-3]|uniref:hypothetical protein n=1 Tax=unclassified Helicobacter TaxID=2593540 RepID=UPI000804FEFD|nr:MULTISPECIES: hypothetical protein [unclassified Helicobacter]OBV29358.1 hypothetical protein BA723_05770 [Helicobacter sp. CLO-3]OHU82616.1 hypothetical protein BKN38_06805 [Helicobacter sp. CLO-3]
MKTLTKLSSVALLGLGLISSANAVEINVNPYGKLGGIASLDFTNSKQSYGGVLANAGADFSLTNGLRWGLGAIGAWTPWEQTNNISSPYASAGDASEAYIGYKNKLIEFYAGRFKNGFTNFDWLQGNVQGASIRFTTYESKMIYWLTYANSYLYNGKQHNYIQGDRIAADLTSLTSYNTTGGKKNSMVGGEIIAGGVDFAYNNFWLKPYVLFNTNAAGTKSILLQGGLKAGISFDISKFKSTTIFQAMYQYWDLPTLAANDSASSILLWADQTFRYQNFLMFGAGIVGIPGNEKSTIYALSDSSKFYGRMFASGMSGPLSGFAPYFAGTSLYGYVFGGLDMKWVRVDGMVSFGTYNEYSIMSNFPVWQQKNMKLSLGVGYAYIKGDFGGGTDNVSGNSLKAFAKFSY